jgi:riboflavin transporter FmnP
MRMSYVVEREFRVITTIYQIVSKYAFSRKAYQETAWYCAGEHVMRLYTAAAGRQVAFVASMGALGNVLALLTVTIPTPVSQIAPDLSHVATLIVALYSGPVLGGITGALVSIVPFYRFGVAGWYGPLVGFLIIPLKSLTGITAGLLGKKLRPALATLLGYVPECVSTYAFFMLVVPFFLPQVAQYVTQGFVILVLAKAWVELGIIAIIMEAIKRRDIVGRILGKTN